jgi:hypothetical protein
LEKTPGRSLHTDVFDRRIDRQPSVPILAQDYLFVHEGFHFRGTEAEDLMEINLSLQEYEALLYLARVGATADGRRRVDAFAADIEKRNGVKRYFLWVQWQETNYPLPPTTDFPNKWPPELRTSLERTDRPICLTDIEAVLAVKARKPINVLVTRDPGAELGWTKINDFFKG